jgi:hypothetical protein
LELLTLNGKERIRWAREDLAFATSSEELSVKQLKLSRRHAKKLLASKIIL